ncbi:DUF4138 domain-containing protein [Mucilaginibacter antarcticus]|uniref:DUF4138 domain-containing protein n=1 Tax=Mucilaginibacter antarcticus TaxID=1855725 RepID=UPI00363103F8
MKTILFCLLVLCAPTLYAQDKLPVVYLPENLTIHFVSPEPIQYVDISTKDLVGDLPLKNVLRLKLRDSLKTFLGSVVTIAGEKFIAQYRLLPGYPGVPTEVNIVPSDMQPLDISGIGLSQNQLKGLALSLIAKSSDKRMEKVKAFGIKGQLNHVYTVGDYIFLDIGYHNKTNLKYDIADFRFKVDDKKVTKAANNQSVEVKPEFVLFSQPAFSKITGTSLYLKRCLFRE